MSSHLKISTFLPLPDACSTVLDVPTLKTELNRACLGELMTVEDCYRCILPVSLYLRVRDPFKSSHCLVKLLGCLTQGDPFFWRVSSNFDPFLSGIEITYTTSLTLHFLPVGRPCDETKPIDIIENPWLCWPLERDRDRGTSHLNVSNES